jgi:hypothetical protein
MKAIPTVREWIVRTDDGERFRVLAPTRVLALLNFRKHSWANIATIGAARLQTGQRTMIEKEEAATCPSCGRRYDQMPNRERMLNGNWGHLELEAATGATVLVDEGK